MISKIAERAKRYKRAVCYAVAGVVAVTVFALPLFCKVFEVSDLLFQTSAAILGVVLSAVITFVLLTAQSHTEAEQERSSRVYEQKLAVCLSFLKRLRDVLKDGKVTTEEVNTLKFSFASIAIHLQDVEALARISANLKTIVESCTPSPGRMAGNGTGEEVRDAVVNSIMDIVSIFRKEIYGAKQDLMANKRTRDIIDNLSGMLDGVDIQQVSGVPAQPAAVADTTVPVATVPATTMVELAAKETSPYSRVLGMVESGLRGYLEGRRHWSMNKNPYLELSYTRGAWAGEDNFAIRLKWDEHSGKHYFQCHVDFPGDLFRRDLYLPMRTAFGGGFSKSCWWSYVDDRTNAVLYAANASAEELQYAATHCLDMLKKLADYMDAYFELYDRLQVIANKLKLNRDEWRLGLRGNTCVLMVKEEQKFSVEATAKPDGSFSNVCVHFAPDCPELVRSLCCKACNKPVAEGDTIIAFDTCADQEEFRDKISPICAVKNDLTAKLTRFAGSLWNQTRLPG